MPEPEQTDADVQKSLEKLDDERKTLVGDIARDHTLTGSTTWETLPEPDPLEESEPAPGVEASRR